MGFFEKLKLQLFASPRNAGTEKFLSYTGLGVLAAQIKNRFARKSKEVSVTVPATGWTGSEAPYTNTLTIEDVTATNDISVIPRFTWTAAQAEAWAGAMILSGDQAAGSLTLKAYGDKPEIDIDITVMIGDEVEGGE